MKRVVLSLLLPCFLHAQNPAAVCTLSIDGQWTALYSALNITSGPGIIPQAVYNWEFQRVDLSFSYNTALLMTHDQAHANPNYCLSTNGTPAFTCRLPNKTIPGYTRGMVLLLDTNGTPCPSACSIKVEDLPPINIKTRDGKDPNGSPVTGWVFYDGTNFRVL